MYMRLVVKAKQKEKVTCAAVLCHSDDDVAHATERLTEKASNSA